MPALFGFSAAARPIQVVVEVLEKLFGRDIYKVGQKGGAQLFQVAGMTTQQVVTRLRRDVARVRSLL